MRTLGNEAGRSEGARGPPDMRASLLVCTRVCHGTRYIGVLGSHRYKVVLGLAQLGGPPSGRVGPWRSGDCKSSFPDTFEPERIRTTQCESVQLWQ